jgi:hypothetical protein
MSTNMYEVEIGGSSKYPKLFPLSTSVITLYWINGRRGIGNTVDIIL